MFFIKIINNLFIKKEKKQEYVDFHYDQHHQNKRCSINNNAMNKRYIFKVG